MIHMRIGEPGSRGGQCQWRKLQQRWMVLLCSVIVCSEARSSVGMKPPLGQDMNQMSGRRTRTGWGDTRRASVSVWDGIGRRRSGARVVLNLRCQTQILVCLLGYLVVSNECNFWPKLGAVAQVCSLLQVFFSRDSRFHDGL